MLSLDICEKIPSETHALKNHFHKAFQTEISFLQIFYWKYLLYKYMHSLLAKDVRSVSCLFEMQIQEYPNNKSVLVILKIWNSHRNNKSLQCKRPIDVTRMPSLPLFQCELLFPIFSMNPGHDKSKKEMKDEADRWGHGSSKVVL